MALLTTQGLSLAATFSSPLSYSHHLSATSYSGSRTRFAAGAATVLSATPTPVLDVYCGRGDNKTKRGKRFNHSYGNARPHNKKKGTGPARIYAPPAPPRKDQFDDGEIIQIEIDEDIGE